MTPLFGLVLAGGRSSRMQADKAALAYDCKPQLARAFELLAPRAQGKQLGRPKAAVRPERVLALWKRGMSLRGIAKETGVSAMTVQRVVRASVA